MEDLLKTPAEDKRESISDSPDSAPVTQPTPSAPEEKEAFKLLQELTQQFLKLKGLGIFYLQAHVDKSKVHLKEFFSKAAIALLLFYGITGLFFIALSFTLYGIALGLSQALDEPWLGFLLTGIISLVILSLYLKFKLSHDKKSSLERRIKTYEQEQIKLEQNFGKENKIF